MTIDASFNYQSMYDGIKQDYRSCIDKYREMSDSFLLGWLVEMGQTIKIQDWETAQSVDDNDAVETGYITCPADGVINVIHHFEAQSYLPIKGTEVTVYLEKIGFDSVVGEGVTNENGVALIQVDKNKCRGKRLWVKVEPSLNASHIEELFGSYDSVIERAVTWLDGKWENQKNEWASYIANPLDAAGALEEFLDAFVDAIKDVWDDLKMIFEMLTHPEKLWAMIQKFCDPAEMARMLETAKQEVAKMLILLKDEARLFLCINAIYSWFRTFTPSQVFAIAASAAAALIIEVILNLIMPGGIFRKVLTQFDNMDDLLKALS
ncbi:hypothetical protein ACMXYV_08090 [Neptuniibacter sp. SY11_33]|uniref:hypothetical protein n=1 Tax=Neptuniibacter sp. SY11_33 TaxID=3398215 RepID=UPI0039F496FE